MGYSTRIELSDSIKKQLADGYGKEEAEMKKKYKYVCQTCGYDELDNYNSLCVCRFSANTTVIPQYIPGSVKRVEIKELKCEYCGNKTCTCGATE